MPDLSYRASLKNPHVEEVIDLLVHRPLGYVLARLSYPTFVTPDALTILSMLVGLAAAVAFIWPVFTGESHTTLGGLLFIASAVLDCSDGQLARMRQRSSRYGRMLDGAVDTVVQVTVIPAAVIAMLVRMGGMAEPDTLVWAGLSVLAVLVGVRHTTLYDQFKNVYVRNTQPRANDCDDADDIAAEFARLQAAGPVPWTTWFRFRMYQVHLNLVAQTMRWVDPCIPEHFRDMPAYDDERAANYRQLNDGLMRGWSFFGIGTHIFLVSVCSMVDHLEWYIVLRLVGFNALLAVLLPMQRRASRNFFGARIDDTPEATAA